MENNPSSHNIGTPGEDNKNKLTPDNFPEENTLKTTSAETNSSDKSAKPSDDWRTFIPKLLHVSPSPHIRTTDTTQSIMIDVCIALLPALIWGVYVFGARAITITAISVIFSAASEFIYQKLMKKPITVLDFSAVVTGLLLAMCLPVSVPLWMPAIGSIFAIVVVKQLFGGIGKNFVNPALAARVFLYSWPTHMNFFTAPGQKLPALAVSVNTADVVAGATPLVSLKKGAIAETSLFDMIIGYEGGCIGEVSALLLTAGFVYLLYRKVITWKIPVTFIATVLIATFLFSRSTLPINFALSEIFSGGLFLGAIFMATDYTTSPVTEMGRVIFGIGCGLLTVLIRYFGGYVEGVSFAILIMNLLVWYIDRYTKPVRFGGAGNEKSKQQT
jgi:electron transport complex protein RnfD